jgi:hypothetical protein
VVGTMRRSEMYVKVIDPHVDNSQGTIPRSSAFLSEHGINCFQYTWYYVHLEGPRYSSTV